MLPAMIRNPVLPGFNAGPYEADRELDFDYFYYVAR